MLSFIATESISKWDLTMHAPIWPSKPGRSISRTINRRESTSTKSKLSRIDAVTWQRSAPFGRRASGLIDPECFVIRKVLYSGTHSGDVIPLNELGELSAELHHIRQIDRTSPQMHQLVDELEDLIQAAKDEVNPIVCDIPLRCPRVNCAS